MKILIVGAGIAGLSTAYWLDQYGFDVDIIEKSEHFQSRSGYMIDFWGPGFDVAEKMGIIQDLKQKDHRVSAIKFVNAEGKTSAKMQLSKLRQLLDNRMYTFLRGDLENVLLESIQDRITIQAGTQIQSLSQSTDQVEIEFSNGQQVTYDLVIGADGIHSSTRQFVFGDEKQFSQYLGYRVGAFIQPNRLNIQNDCYTYSEPEKEVMIYPTRENALATFFIYKSKSALTGSPQERLIQHFKDFKWVVPDILADLEKANEVFLDTLTQIVMPTWYQGRVVLVGDACQCLTLMAGQGASMAMAGGYVLAKQLQAHPNHYTEAFKHYQSLLQPSIISKQKEAKRFIRSFVPNTWFGIRCRNIISNWMTLPIISKFVFGGLIKEKLKLPD